MLHYVHAQIIPEQNASKIVKICQQMAKFCQKLKWLLSFWDRCIKR